MAYTFDDLVQIMAKLRSPEGCPWDREQTHSSLLKYLLEESAEVVEAVQSGDMNHVQEELGDVLLQVVFHSQLAKETGTFSIEDVVQTISEKMIRRHPHVFGDAQAKTAGDVLVQWEEIKAKEKPHTNASKLDKVPRSLGALMRAQTLRKKATGLGFPEKSEDQTAQEIRNLLESLSKPQRDDAAAQAAYGELLFQICAWGQKKGLDAEQALIGANLRFETEVKKTL